MNILVIQMAKIGDLVQTAPLIDGIRKKYPEAFLSILVDSRYAPVASGFSDVDEVICLNLESVCSSVNDRKLSLPEKYERVAHELAHFKKRNFGRVYNINSSMITAIICLFFRKSEIIGYRLNPLTRKHIGEAWAKFILHLMRHRRIMRINLVDLWAHYEEQGKATCPHLSFMADAAETGPRSFLPLGDRGGVVIGMQMGCGGEFRQWPVEYYAALAYKLVREMNACVILLGSRSEQHLGRRFNREWLRMGGEAPSPGRVIDLIGETSIPELASTLQACDMVIGGDTGTLHLAAASGTRVAGLYMGTASCHETGPYGDGHYVLQACTPCSPCNQGDPNAACGDPVCLHLIRPDTVFALVSFMLKMHGKDGPYREIACKAHPFHAF